MRVSAIAAISEKSRALGKDNDLLWRIPEDLQRLRSMTTGHSIIMGRKTMDHLLHIVGRALPNRTNIVVSRDKTLKQEGFVIVHSLEEAISTAAKSEGSDEAFIFGGAQLFTLALPKTQRLYLTIVKDEPAADAFFPEYPEFTKVLEKSNLKEHEGVRYYYLTLERP